MSTLPDELRTVTKLAGPVVLAQLGLMSMSVVDAMMVGRLDALQMAGVTAGTTWFFAVQVFAFGVLHSLDPLFSQAWGARDRAGGASALGHGLALAALLAPLVFLGDLLAGVGLPLLGQPEDVVPIAASYARIAGFGVPGWFLFLTLRLFLQARGLMRPATAAVLLANGVNAALDYAFVFGKWGAPAMGAAGAAVATATCQYVQVALLVWLARPQLRDAWAAWRERAAAGLPAPGPVLRLFRDGLPMGFQISTEVWAFQIVTFLSGRVGTDALAAHGLVLNLASLSFMVPLGVGTAAATRVGNLVGAGETWGKAAKAALILGVGGMALSATTFALVPEALARLYTHEAAVVALGASILPIAAAFQLFDGTQAVCYGLLRGAGDTRLGAIANLVGYYAVGLPIGAWLAFPRGWGLAGLWTGLAVGLATVATLLVVRLRWTVRRGGFRVRLDGAAT